ncbi:uncharacterized protein LOC144146380 [Haemaphysalis longicornis]
MDNAPYHSVQTEKLPSTSWRKVDIQSWLTAKTISWCDDQLKPELLRLVNENKHKFFGYRIEALTRVVGDDFVRLPPYHYEFNPFKVVWSQVNGFIAANNTSFTLAEVERILNVAIALVTLENWVRDCAHVEHLEKEARQRDGAIDTRIDNVVILLGSDSSSSSDCSDSETSGLEEL